KINQQQRTVGLDRIWRALIPLRTLVSAPLTGDNYLVWSRAVKFALGAENKLSFIDGRSVHLADNSKELDEWIRIDYMIITWILNLVLKQIVDAFIYITSARALWLKRSSKCKCIYQMQYQLQYKDSKKDKRSMFCEHYRKPGHLKETWFKLNGTPEWYRDLTEKKKNRAGRGRGFVAAIETVSKQSNQPQVVPKTRQELN
ncbi:UNVERIFIED_CONTAM: hypothetical protein Slati_2765000, partial [Sesamum latifolium]